MSALAGQVANPQTYNDDTRKLVARASRVTNSSTTTTEIDVLRLDGLALKAGRVYNFRTGSLQPVSSVANDYIAVKLRYSSTGTASTAGASTVLMAAQARITGAGGNETVHADVMYAPAADETGSLVLTIARVSGTGNASISGGATLPIDLCVYDCGPDPGNTGVSL